MTNLFPALIVDFETTGLLDFTKPADDPSQPRIIEIAAILLSGPVVDAPREIIDHCIKPDGWTMPPELVAEMGHGLTQDVLESEGVPIEVALDGFLAFMDEAKVVASYGITFDTKMLRGELRRLGKPDLFGTKPEFCLMREATRQCKAAGEKLPGRRNVKLVRACEVLLGRVHDRPHRAMPDAEVAADLYQHFAHMGCLEPKVRESIQKPAA